VSIIPIRHPNTELKTAAASFPPTAFVRMTADDTGGGMQPTVINLMAVNKMSLIYCNTQWFR
jgi:hypothetical protein